MPWTSTLGYVRKHYANTQLPLLAGVDNSAGQYAWAVDCSLGDQATYGLKITWDGDATGTTFQYSNPFQITKSTSSSSSSSAAAAPATTSAAYNADAGVLESTLYSTDYVTITSCAATVSDCPARPTGASSAEAVPTGPAGNPPAVVPSAPAASVPAYPQTTLSPVYPAGNGSSSSGNGGYGGNIGTVTIPKSSSTTGAGTAPSSSTTGVVTAGAGRVAAGSVALVAGAVAVLFSL